MKDTNVTHLKTIKSTTDLWFPKFKSKVGCLLVCLSIATTMSNWSDQQQTIVSNFFACLMLTTDVCK